jgi:prevent-host-death family protein
MAKQGQNARPDPVIMKAINRKLLPPMAITQHLESSRKACTLIVYSNWVEIMQTINVRETRERLSALLDAVAVGEEITILRHGKPVARLTTVLPERIQFPNRSELRASLPPALQSSAQMVRELRDGERY